MIDEVVNPIENRIKVLHLVSDDRTGGIKALLDPILNGLNNAGVEADLCILSSKRFADSIKIEGVRKYYLDKRFTFDLRVIYQLVKMLRAGKYHILHTHSLSNNFYGRLASVFLPGLKVVTTVHSDIKTVMLNSHGVFFANTAYFFERALSGLTDLYLPVSDDILEILRAKGFPDTKVMKVTNGLDLALRNQNTLSVPTDKERENELRTIGISPKNSPILMTIGRLNKIKNQGIIIQAAAQLRSDHPNFKAVIIGTGPLRKDLEELIDQYGVRDLVVLTGNLPEAYRFIKYADVFLITSHYEGLPVSALEALFFKKPIIASSVGGLPEIVEDGVNGYLIRPDDVNSLVEKVKLLAADHNMRREMGENSYKRLLERFSESKMIEGLINAYRCVVNNH